MQGKGLTPIHLLFRVVSPIGKVLESSKVYTGLKDCVADVNSSLEGNESVSYSKVYRNIRLYGFHCEAIRYWGYAKEVVRTFAIVVFTDANEKAAPTVEDYGNLFSPVESQVAQVMVQGPVFASVESEFEAIYSQFTQDIDDLVKLAEHQVQQTQSKVRAQRAKGISKVLKQGSEKKVPHKPRKAAKKA